MVDIQALTLASGTAGSVVFSPAVNLITIHNEGIGPAHINIDAAATTSHFKLDYNDIINIGLNDTLAAVHGITDHLGSSTLKIVGVDAW